MYNHEEENVWDACGIDKKEIKRCKRKVEDIVDELQESGWKTSKAIEAIEAAAREDEILFRFILVYSEVVSVANKTQVISLPGSGILGALLGGSGKQSQIVDILKEITGECDCDDCKELKDKLEGINSEDDGIVKKH